MLSLAPKLNSHLEIVAQLNYSEKQLKGNHLQHSKQPDFLQAILEGLVDGILILTEQGELVHANECARRICQQISQLTSQHNSIPQPIWQVCQSLIESRDLFPGQKIIIENEIDLDNSATFRIRVRWLTLNEDALPYLLVTIEDKHQSSQNAALTDANKYGLTPREAEVWTLRLANHSYQEIADKLYITINTVKKHLKNIYAKQEEFMWSQE